MSLQSIEYKFNMDTSATIKLLREKNSELADLLERGIQKMEKLNLDIDRQFAKLRSSLDVVSGEVGGERDNFIRNLVDWSLSDLLSRWGMEISQIKIGLPIKDSDGFDMGEVDLLALGEKEVVVLEVQTSLTSADLTKFLSSLKDFKEYFPEYKDKEVYGAVACLFSDDTNEAEENGLFVVKAVGGQADISVITNAKGFKPKVF